MVDVQIQNVVASANLNQEIDLPSVMKAFVNVDYRPKRFPGLVFRLKRPKTSTLIFRTGKMICTGARSEKTARSAVKKVVRALKKGGIIILGRPKIVIQNIVATAEMDGGIDLVKAVDVMRNGNMMYEPEQFPGIIYRMRDPKVVMLLFSSGKIVITGARSGEEARDAVEKLGISLRDNHLIIVGSENG